MLRGALATLVALLAGAAPAAADVRLGDCLWQRNDPLLLNALYPDAAANYYTVRLPPGPAYELRGQFPHARYMSFVSYGGVPIDALLDSDVVPDAGSSNPFVTGADRTVAQRSYTVPLLAGARAPGALDVGRGPVQVILRVYVPDRGRDAAGGVPLPEIVARGPLSADLRALPCPKPRESTGGALAAAQSAYANASLPVAPPVTSPSATDPPAWSVESGLTAALLGRAGQGGLVSGGPASNPHNTYVAASVARRHGEVLAIRAKAPSTPATAGGEPVMTSADLRYWSLCQNGTSTRYVACLHDDQVALDADGSFTIAISDPAHRPRSARNWLPFGAEPGGQVLYRHMLPSPAFLPFSAQGAGDRPPAETMGAYFPRAAYCSRARFEADACGLR